MHTVQIRDAIHVVISWFWKARSEAVTRGEAMAMIIECIVDGRLAVRAPPEAWQPEMDYLRELLAEWEAKESWERHLPFGGWLLARTLIDRDQLERLLPRRGSRRQPQAVQ